MLIQIFWNKRNKRVIVPTVAQTEAGYWMGIEPVQEASWNDLPSVVRAVDGAVARSGQIVPTPSRQNFPEDVVVLHSKVKSTSELEKKYNMVSIYRNPDRTYSINRYKKSPEGVGGVFDSDASTTYPSGTSLEQALRDLAGSINS